MVIAIVSTGGTIASTAHSNNGEGASPELTGADLVDAVPELRDEASIKINEFSNIPSPHFSVEQMVELKSIVASLDSDKDIDGIVITQGTDTLEETAYFVDCCYDGTTPVVFTGAMRNPSLPSPDGPANLLASVRTALSAPSRGQGVLVTFNDRVYPARDVTKMHSMNPDTFRAPEFGPLAVHNEGRIVWRCQIRRSRPVLDPDPNRISNDVFALTITADMSPVQIPKPSECTAVCLATTGAGHIPPSIISDLEVLAHSDVPLVATTRCPEGRLSRSTYSFLGSEETLQELECYYSDRNLQKTRIETIAALASNTLEATFIQP